MKDLDLPAYTRKAAFSFDPFYRYCIDARKAACRHKMRCNLAANHAKKQITGVIKTVCLHISDGYGDHV